MPFAATAHINLDALSHNVDVIRRQAPGANIMAAVKANAYGHGIIEIAAALTSVDCLAVARIGEARQLRAAGIRTPLCLLEGVFDASELVEAVQLDCELTVHTREQIELLESMSVDARVVWVKINTGMNRLGFLPSESPELMRRLQGLTAVRELRVMTHFASADIGNHSQSKRQIEAFATATEGFQGSVSIANSAAIFGDQPLYAATREPVRARSLWVRPGIALYGVSPFNYASAEAFGLHPVMNLDARLIAVQSLRKGDPVGYGGRFRASTDMRIGVVAAGYGDGYPRMMPDGTPVLVDGISTRLVGRVSMDMLTVDLGPCPDAGYGSSVRLWGEGLPVETIAWQMDNIGYELLTRVSSRVQRTYD